MTAPTATREELRLDVEGMDCPSCALKIETALGRLPGVHVQGVDVLMMAGASGTVLAVSLGERGDQPIPGGDRRGGGVRGGDPEG